jgi:hypothetical protein
MKSRVLAVSVAGTVAFAVAGAYARQAPEARPDAARPSDPAAAKIDFTKVKSRTVEEPRHLTAPKNLKATGARRRGTERTGISVKGLLMFMKREDDSDIHLVIADPKFGGSMIVEFLGAPCVTPATPAEPGAKTVTPTGLATITGVGFFDRVRRRGERERAPPRAVVHEQRLQARATTGLA